ncbi:unnamed protein product [Paramecium sonneborni]|uniref:Uncharacterized protein n=1 Tax=Paramecium sonneborni TaxID=65129 RepID=A0A8S1RTB7_9CILI|nr:unnamed protein product [Paramecium sonneborni]
MKVGRWDIMYQESSFDPFKQIGGGLYNNAGLKQGKWIEPDEVFYKDKKVTYNGQYNMKGKKVGSWDIMYDRMLNGEYIQMYILEIIICDFVQSGGGSYDQVGNQKKIGRWMELYENFQYNAQVIYIGEYNQNGMKVGKWNIMFREYDEKEYEQMQ